MKHLAIATLVTLPISAFAQEEAQLGEAQGNLLNAEVVPGRASEEGARRYDARLPENLHDYKPQVLPEAGPNVGQRQRNSESFVSYDPATGTEQTITLANDPFRSRGFLSGFEAIAEVEEGMDSDFGAFTQQNSTASPWSTQCRIFFNQAGGSYICSGTLIDAKYVITAGHCVHAGAGGTWSSNVVVAPRWDGDSDAFGLANGTNLAASAGWKSSSNYNDDMGWIRLDRPVGFLTGWLGSFYNSSNSFWSSTTFHLAGFPGSVSSTFPNAPHALYYAYGSWNNIGTYQVTTKFPTSADFGGLSGAGYYYRDSAGNRYVGAAHSHSTNVIFWIDRTGTRNTQGKYNYFHDTFKPAGYSTTQADFVPLKVRTSPTTIRRGFAFTSASYRVGNASLFNPPSLSVATDVYLSSNDNISEADTRIQQHNFTHNFGAQTSVNVNMPSLVIPAATAPGTYYVGVITTTADASSANNDTDGWDAQRITVTN